MSEETTSARLGTVLIVDDSTANLQLLMSILQQQGYVVYPASEGKLALRFLQSILPDLILLDIKMPGMDGFEVCRLLKADERTRGIPIIFISVLEGEHDKVRAFQVGGMDYIAKPFHPEEVLARVENQLRLRELTEQLERKISERTEELTKINERLHEEIAERRRAEEALRKREALLNVTQRLSKVGGWEFDVKSGSFFWTEELYRIHELPNNPAIDHLQESLRCYDPKDRPVIMTAFQNAHEKGEPYDLEFPFTTKKGNRLWIRTTALPVYESSEVVRVVGNLMDITERKRTEEEIRSALNEKEILLREVHHRVKNNMQVISSLLNLQLRRTGNETAAEVLRSSRQRVESLALAHERLYHSKDFARLKMSEYLSSLLLGIQQAFQESANRVSLRTDLEDIPVSMDQAIPLGLIVTELVTNALKYAFPEGHSGILTISVKTGDGDEAVILVADNGVGLPRGLDWRQNNTLGLRLVHDLCHQIGGTISLDRSKGVCWKIIFNRETL